MTPRSRFTMTTFVSAAALVAGIAAPAFAQDVHATDAASTVGNDTETSGLGDIIVTARKVSENLQDVPVAITVQTGQALQNQSAVRIPDVARLSPGITFSPASSTATASAITIRGQVQTDILATLDPSVGTYVDGFYWARAYGLNADLLDVQSAQILRGPQGTLFGRNTTGGALLLQTNDPTYNGVGGQVSATYGRFNERVGTAILNVPLIEDKVAIRGAFTANKRDGFFTDTATGSELGGRNSYTARVKLLINPTHNLSLLFSGEIFHSNSITRPYQLQYVSGSSAANIEAALEANPANAALLATPAGQGQLVGIGSSIFTNYINGTRNTDSTTLNEDPRSYATTHTYTGTATLDTFFGAIKFIGGYRKIAANANIDLDGSPINIVRTYGQQDLESYSGELQVTGKAFNDALDFATGVYAFNESGRDQSTSIALPVLTRISNGGVLPQTYYIGDVTNRSMGMYGQGTLHFNDKLSVVAGVRYSVEDKNLVSYNQTRNFDTGALISCLIVGSDPTNCRIERHAAFSGVSYTAGLNYQITPGIMVYAKTSKGFRSGGQNLRAADLPGASAGAAFVPFQPEIAREEEIGLKSEFFDRRIRFNLAAFYNEVSNIQRTSLLTTVINGVTSTATIVSNAGKARFYGGEAELTAQVFEGFTLSGTAALSEPKYLSYTDTQTGEDKRDEVFQQVPKITFSVASDYEHELNFGKLRAHLDYAWQGKTALYNYRTLLTGNAATDANTIAIANALTRKAGGEVNGRLGVTFMDDAFEVAVFGRNILNRRYNNTGLLFGAPLNVASTQRNDPATYGVTATFKFGAK
ncbi:TonB-dependent receptor (plasmid) [Sphingomonas paeninsulae]|uniref:TonB-dependent receptor n=1 Tax=Sphingomonas paeninsulae TaxID=2319844 RepID=A0A494T700_SPHPE|nr:TonB-dependent receptor [Sphingomonas paeninsulae]AYJ85179.1 TonB-dependent receptor [Sphingomonas paeninsulae]